MARGPPRLTESPGVGVGEGEVDIFFSFLISSVWDCRAQPISWKRQPVISSVLMCDRSQAPAGDCCPLPSCLALHTPVLPWASRLQSLLKFKYHFLFLFLFSAEKHFPAWFII